MRRDESTVLLFVSISVRHLQIVAGIVPPLRTCRVRLHLVPSEPGLQSVVLHRHHGEQDEEDEQTYKGEQCCWLEYAYMPPSSCVLIDLIHN